MTEKKIELRGEIRNRWDGNPIDDLKALFEGSEDRNLKDYVAPELLRERLEKQLKKPIAE